MLRAALLRTRMQYREGEGRQQSDTGNLRTRARRELHLQKDWDHITTYPPSV